MTGRVTGLQGDTATRLEGGRAEGDTATRLQGQGFVPSRGCRSGLLVPQRSFPEGGNEPGSPSSSRGQPGTSGDTAVTRTVGATSKAWHCQPCSGFREPLETGAAPGRAGAPPAPCLGWEGECCCWKMPICQDGNVLAGADPSPTNFCPNGAREARGGREGEGRVPTLLILGVGGLAGLVPRGLLAAPAPRSAVTAFLSHL